MADSIIWNPRRGSGDTEKYQWPLDELLFSGEKGAEVPSSMDEVNDLDGVNQIIAQVNFLSEEHVLDYLNADNPILITSQAAILKEKIDEIRANKGLDPYTFTNAPWNLHPLQHIDIKEIREALDVPAMQVFLLVIVSCIGGSIYGVFNVTKNKVAVSSELGGVAPVGFGQTISPSTAVYAISRTPIYSFWLDSLEDATTQFQRPSNYSVNTAGSTPITGYWCDGCSCANNLVQSGCATRTIHVALYDSGDPPSIYGFHNKYESEYSSVISEKLAYCSYDIYPLTMGEDRITYEVGYCSGAFFEGGVADIYSWVESQWQLVSGSNPYKISSGPYSCEVKTPLSSDSIEMNSFFGTPFIFPVPDPGTDWYSVFLGLGEYYIFGIEPIVNWVGAVGDVTCKICGGLLNLDLPPYPFVVIQRGGQLHSSRLAFLDGGFVTGEEDFSANQNFRNMIMSMNNLYINNSFIFPSGVNASFHQVTLSLFTHL
jgi:hypothetical protein